MKDHTRSYRHTGDFRFYRHCVRHRGYPRPDTAARTHLLPPAPTRTVAPLTQDALLCRSQTRSGFSSKRPCFRIKPPAYLVDSFFAFPKERPYNLVFLAFFLAVPFAAATSAKPIYRVPKYAGLMVITVISAACLLFAIVRFQGECVLKAVLESSSITPEQRLARITSIRPWAYAADPFSIPISHYEGMAWLGVGNVVEAKFCFLKAYAMYPYQPDVLLNLGTACEVTGERDKAKRLYQEAMSVSNSDVRPKLNLAVIEFKEGAYAESAEIFRRIDTNLVKEEPQTYAQYQILKNSLKRYLR